MVSLDSRYQPVPFNRKYNEKGERKKTEPFCSSETEGREGTKGRGLFPWGRENQKRGTWGLHWERYKRKDSSLSLGGQMGKNVINRAGRGAAVGGALAGGQKQGERETQTRSSCLPLAKTRRKRKNGRNCAGKGRSQVQRGKRRGREKTEAGGRHTGKLKEMKKLGKGAARTSAYTVSH